MIHGDAMSTISYRRSKILYIHRFGSIYDETRVQDDAKTLVYARFLEDSR
jgi:hypothetical protein